MCCKGKVKNVTFIVNRIVSFVSYLLFPFFFFCPFSELLYRTSKLQTRSTVNTILIFYEYLVGICVDDLLLTSNCFNRILFR